MWWGSPVLGESRQAFPPSGSPWWLCASLVALEWGWGCYDAWGVVVLPSAFFWQEWCVSFAQWGRNAGRYTFLHDLSPRGRGNLHRAVRPNLSIRSIPAWAGEPNVHAKSSQSKKVYPRVGGGTPIEPPPPRRVLGLSPRGRGNHTTRPQVRRKNRSIPAWAGEPHHVVVVPNADRVYPRVGGGTCADAGRRGGCGGLSPRGRGNLLAASVKRPSCGSIPAWAGEPSS